MMVCMPRTCGVLLRTLSVLGRGWHWCAEARAALRTQTDWELEEGISPRALPSRCRLGGAVVVRTAVCQVGAILPVVDVEEGPHSRMPSPITARQGLKDTV